MKKKRAKAKKPKPRKNSFKCPGCGAENYISFTALISSGSTKAARTDRRCQNCSKSVRMGVDRMGKIIRIKLAEKWGPADDEAVQKAVEKTPPTGGPDPVTRTYIDEAETNIKDKKPEKDG